MDGLAVVDHHRLRELETEHEVLAEVSVALDVVQARARDDQDQVEEPRQCLAGGPRVLCLHDLPLAMLGPQVESLDRLVELLDDGLDLGLSREPVREVEVVGGRVFDAVEDVELVAGSDTLLFGVGREHVDLGAHLLEVVDGLWGSLDRHTLESDEYLDLYLGLDVIDELSEGLFFVSVGGLYFFVRSDPFLEGVICNRPRSVYMSA